MLLYVSRRETIKPSSPTPVHLRNLKLSCLDQFASTGPNPRMLLFYSAQGDVCRFDGTNVSNRLKKSLSSTLAEFYPLAGVFSNNQLIECNDGGVEYIEARVRAPFMLDQLLSCPNSEELEQLYPPDTSGNGGLCAAQVTIFEGCGGIAIGVYISHAVGDASALAKFIDSWATITRGGKIISPKFGFAHMIPPRDIFANIGVTNDDATQPKILKPAQKLITKRFVVSKTEITALMANCASQSPTRVQVVCAFIFKCLIGVVRSKSSKPIVLSMPINWRSRMSPRVPPQYLGNFASSSMSSEFTEPKSFHDLVGQVREMIEKYDSEYLKTILANDAIVLFNNIQQEMKLYIKNEVHFLEMSSGCRLPFYEVDFGWGKPTWVTVFVLNVENFVTLLETKNGEGIEAWVTLDDEDMTKFESEYEYLLRDLGASHTHIMAKI